jgi:N-acyl homoserine lactone hydrolase
MAIHRLDLGYFVRPAPEAGPQRRVEAALAYLVRRDEGLLLFDTGIGAVDPETEAHYRPMRRSLPDALAAAGVRLTDVDLVVNCHLHFDHSGGNPLFPGVPIVAQTVEMSLVREGDHTVADLVDFPDVVYREVDGETELWPGVRVIPTPGHTAGHQSLVVEEPDGAVILAGQAYHFASDFAFDLLARQAAEDGLAPPLPARQPWLDRLLATNPRHVLFAHDPAAWHAD